MVGICSFGVGADPSLRHGGLKPTLLLSVSSVAAFHPAWKVISRYGANGLRRLTVFSCVVLGTASVAYGWYLQFWGWS